jgi:hypothetical protein
MPKNQQSNRGLIVTLVFFILATIALGVSTYYGFAEQERLTKEKSDALAKEKSANAERDWWKVQAWVYRAFMGHTGTINAEELSVLKSGLDEGRISGPGKDEVVALLKDLTKQGKLPWPKGRNLPDVTFEKLLSDQTKAANDVRARNQQLEADLEKAKKTVAATEEAFAEARKEFKTELEKLTKKSTDDLSGLVAAANAARDEYNKLSAAKTAEAKKIEDAQTKFAKDRARLEKDRKEALERAEAAQFALDQLRNKASTEAPLDWRSDWKITQIDPRGQLVYVNLGAADRVRPQLTFSIHNVDATGKPLQASKGSLEIINVLGDRQSLARLTEVKDRNRDPVLVGDVLYNPTWSPTLKKHVAIAGVVDLTGDGRDGMPELLRNLERQNVIVDAYIDLKDFTIKGPGMSVKTDFLILADGPEAFSDLSERETKNFVDKLARAMGEMHDQAQRYGVRAIGLRRYLEQIGYRLPRALADQKPGKSSYRPRVGLLEPEDAPRPPAQPKAPEQPNDDKPADDKNGAEKDGGL